MTTITNPRDARIQAIFVRAHLRMLAAGMKNSRLSGTKILEAASKLTGHIYKRGQYAIALEDLQRIIDR
jgi:hypothetical protein